MIRVLAVAALGAALASPAVAGGKAKPNRAKHVLIACATCDFDLADTTSAEANDALPVDPFAPRAMDTRNRRYTPPHIRVESGKGGPVLTASALGRSRKGVPGLAHVAIGWNF